MREIKFRAWNGKAMEYGGFSVHASGSIQPFHPLTEVTTKSPLMQFTGLFDKSGKETYEGDIIEQEVHPYPFKYKVGWRDIECCFYAECIDSDEWFMLYDFDFTVIGNIHQQPELLESDNG